MPRIPSCGTGVALSLTRSASRSLGSTSSSKGTCNLIASCPRTNSSVRVPPRWDWKGCSQTAHVPHRPAFHANHNVVRLDSGIRRGLARRHILNQDPILAREAQGRSQRRRHRANRHAQLAPAHSPIFLKLGVDILHQVDRYGEAQPLAASGLGEDEGVDAHDSPCASINGPPLSPGLMGASV